MPYKQELPRRMTLPEAEPFPKWQDGEYKQVHYLQGGKGLEYWPGLYMLLFKHLHYKGYDGRFVA